MSDQVIVKEAEKSGSGAIAAVIIALLLVLFGWWAVNTFVAADGGDVVPDEIGITVTEEEPAP